MLKQVNKSVRLIVNAARNPKNKIRNSEVRSVCTQQQTEINGFNKRKHEMKTKQNKWLHSYEMKMKRIRSHPRSTNRIYSVELTFL